MASNRWQHLNVLLALAGSTLTLASELRRMNAMDEPDLFTCRLNLLHSQAPEGADSSQTSLTASCGHG